MKVKSYKIFYYCCCIVLVVLISGCTSQTARAPLQNAWYQPHAQQGTYLVAQGDTLYSIAWSFALDYRSLAVANNLQPPYSLRVGQRLIMKAMPQGQAATDYAAKPAVSSAIPQTNKPPIITHQVYKNTSVKQWAWPAKGKILQPFSASTVGNKGIDIAGTFGDPILASAGGVVVYSGSGVRGYGNLIIIKHNDDYLSAYAYNSQNLVKNGDKVTINQRIATMGRTDAGRVLVHFEIRKQGNPVNPMKYLG